MCFHSEFMHEIVSSCMQRSNLISLLPDIMPVTQLVLLPFGFCMLTMPFHWSHFISCSRQVKQTTIELDIEKESNRFRSRHSLGRRSVPRAPIQPLKTTATEMARIEREQLQLVNDAKKEVNTAFLKIDALENQVRYLNLLM